MKHLGLDGAIVALLIALSTIFAPAAGAADPLHTFNATLSLTGGCSTGPLDGIPDGGPGCPGPHPPASFASPKAVTTDSYGNIYVASLGKNEGGSEGRIDVFDPSGLFITELEATAGPMAMAVDSDGVLYVTNRTLGKRLVRYTPSAPYNPAAGEISYGDPPATLVEIAFSPVIALSVNASNNHLFANFGPRVTQYGSAEEGNPVLDEITAVESPQGSGLAVDAEQGRLYATSDPLLVEVFNLAAPHEKLDVIEGSAVPGGKFLGPLSVAVDEGTGHLFVYDGDGTKVYEFDQNGTYLNTIEHGFVYSLGAQPGVDNGKFSPNGALSTEGRYLYVPSHPIGTGHSFAFGPPSEVPAEIVSASARNISTSEAELQALINPGNLPTEYTFELSESPGFTPATVVGGGHLPAVKTDREALALAENLTPGTRYYFRVSAGNALDGDEFVGQFSTYPESSLESAACPNRDFRIGAAALLPDCRAYELVTPPDTNGRTPIGLSGAGMYFTSSEASLSGDKVSFHIEGGSLPDTDATGSFHGDPYLAIRGSEGWSSAYVGPTGSESPVILPGSSSADQGFSFWSAAGPHGSAAVNEEQTSYVRYPDGKSLLVGRGSIGSDPQAVGRLISEGGGHIVFVSGGLAGSVPVQLEPSAPPDGTQAVYDLTADGVTHVVSLLPGDVTPEPGKAATYQGGSLDGRGLAFSIGSTLYLRYQNERTIAIGTDVQFAGVASGGAQIFYMDGGQLMRRDVLTEAVTPFTPSGTVIPVNISADGSTAYFVSTAVLTGDANPNGSQAEPGEQNFYLSREGTISFIGVLTQRDVEGENGGVNQVEGLGLWLEAIGPSEGPPGSVAVDPSRATPDGGVLLFESRADLTGYDPEGRAQVYRYDSQANTLDCISCNPTELPPTGDASLQQVRQEGEELQVLNAWNLVSNLRADGRRAYFQSPEALVPGDTDGLLDVYEWEAQGVGSCTDPSGCIYLISSGHSRRSDYLFAVSASGDDVFVLSPDLLVPNDADETPSIYDARVGGGFPEQAPAECQGEGCRPTLSPAPVLPPPVTSGLGADGNVKPAKRCPKGKRKVKKHGSVRCVKKRQHRRQRAHSRGKGAPR